MCDLKSDWKRWSHAEQVSAIAIVAAAVIVCGSSTIGGLTVGSGGLLAGTSAERSSADGSNSFHQQGINPGTD
jgi:hypothetical protein